MDPILLDIPTLLRGERVTVRLLQDGDADALFEAVDVSRDRLLPWMPWASEHVSVADSLLYIRRSHADWLQRTRLPVGIFISATGKLIGGSGLERIDWHVGAFEIGYWVRLDFEGNGFVQESVRVLTAFAFDVLLANRVQVRMDPRNARSERVAQRAGFELEGTLRNVALGSDGRPSDRHVYALTAESYRRVSWAREGATDVVVARVHGQAMAHMWAELLGNHGIAARMTPISGIVDNVYPTDTVYELLVAAADASRALDILPPPTAS
jgi:ribosomal-protein-serine acetyltransferase